MALALHGLRGASHQEIILPARGSAATTGVWQQSRVREMLLCTGIEPVQAKVMSLFSRLSVAPYLFHPRPP